MRRGDGGRRCQCGGGRRQWTGDINCGISDGGQATGSGAGCGTADRHGAAGVTLETSPPRPGSDAAQAPPPYQRSAAPRTLPALQQPHHLAFTLLSRATAARWH